MSNQNSVTEHVGQAWGHHREGRNEAAVAEFQNILSQNPNDVDANYGLGLAQKAAGDVEAARTSFQTALRLVEEARETYAAARQEQGDSNIKTPEDDRFQMLNRMVRQRLSELDRV
jgi:Flp pilus assembly protein TadD